MSNSANILEFVTWLTEFDQKHPHKVFSEEYPGVDFLVGLCDDAIDRYTRNYLNTQDQVIKSIAQDGVEIFRSLKKRRLKTLTPKPFEVEVMDALC